MSVNCLSLEIGVTTTCVFSLATSHSLASDAVIEIVMSSSFPVATGSFQCGVSGAGLVSVAVCNSYATNTTIRASSFNLTSSSISPMSLTLNVSLTMSHSVAANSITVNTLSGGEIVDSGTVALTTVFRQLTATELVVASSSATTYSATSYTLAISLPFDAGYLYDLSISVPADLQGGFILPAISSASLVSYAKPTLMATKTGLSSASLIITGLLTPISTAPITVTLNVSYQGILLFYGSQAITMTTLRTTTSLVVVQSN